MNNLSPFRYCKPTSEIIRLAVTLHVLFPLMLRNMVSPLHKRAIETSHELVRYQWYRFGPMLAAEILKHCI